MSNGVVPASGSLPESLKGKVLPGEIRAEARRKLKHDLGVLQAIIDDGEQKGATRVAAVKLKALIAGVTSSQSVPRDVVEEKIGEMARYLRMRLGDEAYATMAPDLSAIWDV